MYPSHVFNQSHFLSVCWSIVLLRTFAVDFVTLQQKHKFYDILLHNSIVFFTTNEIMIKDSITKMTEIHLRKLWFSDVLDKYRQNILIKWLITDKLHNVFTFVRSVSLILHNRKKIKSPAFKLRQWGWSKFTTQEHLHDIVWPIRKACIKMRTSSKKQIQDFVRVWKLCTLRGPAASWGPCLGALCHSGQCWQAEATADRYCCQQGPL